MRQYSKGNMEIILYIVGVISTFFLFYISNKLTSPILIDITLKGSLINILLNNEVTGWDLFLPMILMITGVVILVVILWRMGKAIIHQHDTKLNKLIMALLSALLMTILIKAFLNGWGLFILNFKYIIFSFVLIVTFFTMLSYLRRQRNY